MAARKTGSRKTSGRGKRPAATIDLKAKEITSPAGTGKSLTAKPDQAAKTSTADSGPASKPATPDVSGAPADRSASVNKDTVKDAAGASKAATTPETKSATPKVSAKPQSESSTAGPRNNSDDKPSAPGAKAQAGKTPEPKSSPEKIAKPASAASKFTSIAGHATTKDGTSSGGLGAFLSHLAAGIAGAIVVLLSANTFTTGKLAPGQFNDQTAGITALNDRISALESGDGVAGAASVAKQIAVLNEKISALDKLNESVGQVSASQKALVETTAVLEQRLTDLPERAPVDVGDVNARLGKMEDTLKLIAAGAKGSKKNDVAQIANLTGRVNDFGVQFDTKLEALKEAIEKQRGVRAETETNLRESIATLQAGSKRLGIDLEGAKTLAARNDKRQQASAGGVEKIGVSLSALKTELAGVATRVASFTKPDDLNAALAPLVQQISDLQAAVGEVVQRDQARANNARNVVLSLELANLRRAIERGQPVEAHLADIKVIAPADLDLSPFDNIAENPIPSTSALQSAFLSAARAAIQADANDNDGSVLDRILSNARSVVRVRQTGNLKGESVEAVVARMEHALNNNNLTAAIAEAGQLQGSARLAMEPWLTMVKGRMAIDQAMANIDAALKASLGDKTSD